MGIAGAAYAQQVTPGVATQPAVPTATPTSSAATSSPGATDATAAPATPKRPTTDLINKARRAGYTMKTKSGNYFFCKEDADVGTRLAQEHCVDSEAFALTLERQEQDKDAIRRMSEGQSGSK